MKKILTLLLFAAATFTGFHSFAQGIDCASADPFCTGTTYTFNNNSTGTGAGNGPQAQAGPNYGCLLTQPNPAWYYMEILNPGDLHIQISQSSGGSGTDVDFICWGPFATQSGNCGSLNSGHIIDCSYSTSATEVCDITGAVTGQYYLLLLTNYANVPGVITFSQTSGSGTTNCGVLCSPPNASTAGTQTITCTTTSVTLNGTSTTPGVTYSWAGPGGFTSSSPTPTVSVAGTYTLTVTDPSNPSCPATAQQTVTLNNTPPTATTGATQNITCSAPTANLSVSSTTGGATYSWSGPGGFSSTSATPAVTTAGTYTVTVTSPSSGCTATAQQTLNVNTTPPDAAAGSTINLTCAAPSGNLSGSSSTSGATFSWSGPGGFSSTSANPAVSTAGTYTLTVTNPANGCTATAQQTVNPAPGLPDASTAATTPLTCLVTSINIAGSSTTSGVSYSWSGPGGFSAATAATTVSTAGTYTLTVTDPGSGCSSTATALVTSNTTPPPATTGAPQELTCTVLSLNLSGSSTTPSVSYSWSGPGGFSATTTNPAVTAAGTYTLTVTDSTNGCTSTATQDINSNTTPPDAGAGAAQTLTCTAPSATLSGTSTTPSASYSWSGPAGFSSSVQNPTVTSAGTYTLTVTDPANGCTATAQQIINPSAGAPDATAGAAQTITCTSPSASLSGSSATSGVTYAWSGPSGFASSSANPSVSAAGTYTLVVTDPSNGCSTTVSQTVTANTTPPAASAGADQTLGCGSTQASLDASGSSSGSGFTYSWTNSGGSIISGGTTTSPVVTPGVYTLTVTNTANGCTASDAVVVSGVVTPVADFSATPTSGLAPLAVSFTNNSSNAVTYLWSFGEGTTATTTDWSLVYNNPGSYNVILIALSADGCADTASITIHADELSALVVPNVFTPNGDGHNDVFKPVRAEGLAVFNATVYDRWGLKMFEWSDYNSGWNGKAKNGADAPDGTYYYIIEGKGVDGKEYNYKGSVSLIRK